MTSEPALAGSAQPLVGSFRPRQAAPETPPLSLADVLRKVMSDPLDPTARARLDHRLLDYLERDEEDRKNGRTREHHEKMLQKVIDDHAALRLEMTKRDGVVDNQFTAMRIRQEGFETTVGKLDKRVERVEERLGDVAETTGRFEVEGLKDYKKASQKWMFLFFGAILTIVVTVVSAWLIAKAQIENAQPHDVKELVK